MPLKLLLQLSTRNLFRHKRRNLMLLLAICVAVAGVVVTNALIRGMQYDMREAAVENLTGHIKVLFPGYLDDPNIEKSFHLDPAWHPNVPAGEIAGWTARIRIPAVIMSERETRGIQFVGVDPAQEDISFLGEVTIEGERLKDADDRRVLIGKELARQLETQVGRRLVIITQGLDKRNREAGFRIAGVYDAEGTSLEKQFVFTGVNTLKKMVQADVVTEVSVKLEDDALVRDRTLEEDVKERLESSFSNLKVMDWQQLEPQAAAMFTYVDSAILIWFMVIMGALIFGLINTLITAVMERVKEFGMLRAVGMKPGAVIIQVVLESTIIMLAGVTVGVIVGWMLSTWWLGDGIDLSKWAAGAELAGIRSVLTPRLMGQDIVLVAGLSLVFGVIAALYPAWRAVKIKPLEALRR
ncbi:MAG: ABC transporter permease [Pseudomonadales bacterium]